MRGGGGGGGGGMAIEGAWKLLARPVQIAHRYSIEQ